MESKNKSSREEWGLRETDDKQTYQQATQFPATVSAMSVKATCVSVICMCTHTSTNQTGERARGLLSLKSLELNGFNQQVDKLWALHLLRCHTQTWAGSWSGMGGSASLAPPQAANRQELPLAILNFLLCPLKESFLLLCSF